MNNLPTPLIAAAVFALLFVLERFFPLRNTTRSLVARLFVNLAISVFTFIAAAGLVQPAARWALRWSAGRPFGLVRVIALPVPLEFVLSFLLMDLGLLLACGQPPGAISLALSQRPPHRPGPGCFHRLPLPLWRNSALDRFQSPTIEPYRPFDMGFCRLPTSLSG